MIKLNEDGQNYEILILLTIIKKLQTNVPFIETSQLICNPIN